MLPELLPLALTKPALFPPAALQPPPPECTYTHSHLMVVFSQCFFQEGMDAVHGEGIEPGSVRQGSSQGPQSGEGVLGGPFRDAEE